MIGPCLTAGCVLLAGTVRAHGKECLDPDQPAGAIPGLLLLEELVTNPELCMSIAA